jgi:hypothetical protein
MTYPHPLRKAAAEIARKYPSGLWLEPGMACWSPATKAVWRYMGQGDFYHRSAPHLFSKADIPEAIDAGPDLFDAVTVEALCLVLRRTEPRLFRVTHTLSSVTIEIEHGKGIRCYCGTNYAEAVANAFLGLENFNYPVPAEFSKKDEVVR